MLGLVKGYIGINLDPNHSDVIQTPDDIKQKQKKSDSIKNKSKTSKSNVKKSSVFKSKKIEREPKLNLKFNQAINPSKRHRDRLNSELDNLAKLLPFSEDVIARLDKLSILRLSVSYLRNKNYFKVLHKKEEKSEKSDKNHGNKFSKLLTKAMDGFLLVVTIDGEIFFVSPSVKDYLGYSQSSVLHQSLESFVHDDDKDELLFYLKNISTEKIVELDENNLAVNDSNSEQFTKTHDFTVRLKSVLNNGTSDMYKPFKISGRIRKLNMPQADGDNLKYALFATCAPARTSLSVLEIRMKSTLFCSKNRIDLSFLDLDARGKEYFGYSKKDIFGRSSYVLVHRMDAQHLRCKHTEIMTCGKTSIGMFRLMNKNSDWIWVSGYGRVLYKNGKPDYVVTTNRIVSEIEGQAMLKIRDQADKNSLEKLGLVEPEDEAKSMELGFPKNHLGPIGSSYSGSKDENAIPMVLGEAPHLIDGLMKSNVPKFENDSSLDDVIGNNHKELIPPEPSSTKIEQYYNKMPSEHSSPTECSSLISSVKSSPGPMRQTALMSVNVQQTMSVESGESHQTHQTHQHSPLEDLSPFQQHLSPNKHHRHHQHQHHQQQQNHHHIQQQHYHQQQQQLIPHETVMHSVFSESMVDREIQQNTPQQCLDRNDTNMFGDFNFDHNAFATQPPPPQPRFSFLPPVNSDSSEYDSQLEGTNPSNQRNNTTDMFPNTSPNNAPREQIFEQLVGPNVTINQPSSYSYPYQGQMQCIDRPLSSAFLPHIVDNYLIQQQNSMNSDWQRQNNFSAALYHFMSNNNSPSSGDAHSMGSGQYNDYPVPFNMEEQHLT